jgi:hypothetical protein
MGGFRGRQHTPGPRECLQPAALEVKRTVRRDFGAGCAGLDVYRFGAANVAVAVPTVAYAALLSDEDAPARSFA